MTHAYEMAVFVVAVNRVGSEEGSQCYGTSMIVSPHGEVLAKAGETQDEVVSAVIDLTEVNRNGMLLAGYRHEIYERITEPPRG